MADNAPFYTAGVIFVPAVIYAFYQMIQRNRLEYHYRTVFNGLNMPVSRTMLWFTRLVTAAFILRCAWLFLKATDALERKNLPCKDDRFCWDIVVTICNRFTQLASFVAFSMIGMCATSHQS